jgi:hypothetical protein
MAALALRAPAALAVPINHGDFGPDPPGVTMYLDVTESSATDPIPPARYGVPTLNNDVLDFNPTEFAAVATGAGADITDVQLNFTLMTLPGTGITALAVSESGDFTLVGAGTALTQVVAGGGGMIDIFEVDGVPLAIPISVPFSLTPFMADLVSDGPAVASPWSNGLTIDLAAALAGAGVSFNFGVSKAAFVMNDTLLAISEPASIAFIAKKDFKITTTIVPEPTTWALALIAIGTCGLASRRRVRQAMHKRRV